MEVEEIIGTLEHQKKYLQDQVSELEATIIVLKKEHNDLTFSIELKKNELSKLNRITTQL